MTPRLIIFDLDGTLVEYPFDHFFKRSDEVLVEIGHTTIARDIMQDAFSRFDFFSIFNQQNGENLPDKFWTHFDEYKFPHGAPLPGVHDTLEALSNRGISLAIATARPHQEEIIEEQLEQHGLRKFFTKVISRNSTNTHWTDKTVAIERLCAEHQVKPGDTFMVGDTPSDIISARKVNVGRSVAVLSGGIYRHVLEEHKPDHLIEDVNGLTIILNPKVLDKG